MVFSLGSNIYGRVMVDPVQNLGDSFSCGIEKVFLCTGTDGYVPKYNPINKEYGCLADAPSLLYRLKILVWKFFAFFIVYKLTILQLCEIQDSVKLSQFTIAERLYFRYSKSPCCLSSNWKHVWFFTLGQSPARNPGHCLWKCTVWCFPGFGYPWSSFLSPTTWIWWLHLVIISSFPGQRPS